MAMTAEQIRQRLDEVVARLGPWTAYNIHLGEGVYTMGSGGERMAEQRIARTVRHVADFARRPLSELRILDLGAYEGGFSIELARRGATVVAVEGREAHAEKARFAAEVLGLDRMSVVRADIRNLRELALGSFDVVLCLGVLYHLPAEDVFSVAAETARHCGGFAIVETQVALTATRSVSSGGRDYRGRSYVEDVRRQGASLDNPESFWPTRASLFNLLTDAGFTSIAECRTPVIPSVAAYVDHVTLVAVPGEPADNAPARWPERLAETSHPAQGLRHRLRERVRRSRGGGLAAVFRRPSG